MPPGRGYLGNEQLTKPRDLMPPGGGTPGIEKPKKPYREQTEAQLADLEADKKRFDELRWPTDRREQATSCWEERNANPKRPRTGDYQLFEDYARPIPKTPELSKKSCHLWLDIELVLAWIKTCETEHGGHCQAPSTEALDSSCRPLWLIDVHKGNLKRAERSDQYLALSYVWGDTVTSLMACKRNIDFLQSNGIFKDEVFSRQIPQTIKDAMEFTKMIGQTFLWVDRLCIVQDDSVAKQAQINNMAAIYTNAYLTLVAAVGSSANHGLRGISKDCLPFNKHQPVGSHHSLVNASVWNTRGWTLQELVFSRRAIFLHNHMATWECHCAIWQELKSSGEVASKHDLAKVVNCKERFSHGKGLQHSPWPDLEEYARLAYDFSLRKLTFADDTLSAFAGITTALSRKFHGGFSYGLPDLFFDATLLWLPQDSCIRKKTTMATQLPSWSWMGWNGPFDFTNWASSYDYILNTEKGSKPRDCWPKTSLRTKPILQWRSIPAKDSKDYKIIGHWTLTKNKKNFRESLVEHLSGKWQQNILTDMFYHPSGPLTRFVYPVPVLEDDYNNSTTTTTNNNNNKEPIFDSVGPLLSCNTSRARFKSPKRDWRCALETCALVYNSKGVFGGVVRSQRKDLYGSQEFELIAISAGEISTDESSTHHSFDLRMLLDEAKKQDASATCYFYNVLWVGWEDGVAYRQGFGRILADVWEREATELVDVILG